MKIKPSDVFEVAGFGFFAWALYLWFDLAAALVVVGVACFVLGLSLGDASVKIGRPKWLKVPRRKRER